MAFCENCGKEIRAEAKYCPGCGMSRKLELIEAKHSKENMHSGDQYRPIWSINATNQQGSALDRYGKFIGIGLLAIAIIDFFSDPAFVTILLSMSIIAGAVFCFSRKFKLKVFTILALILAVICLACGIGQAWQIGLFKMPKDGKESVAVTEDADPVPEIKNADNSKDTFITDSDDSKTRDVTYGRITFALPEKYIEKATTTDVEGYYYTKDDKAAFAICCLDDSVPSPNYISPEIRTKITDEAQKMLENSFHIDNVKEVNSEYENIAGLKGIKMSFIGKYNGEDIFSNILFINDPDVNNTVSALQFYIKSAEGQYAKDFGDFFDSARLNGNVSASSAVVTESEPASEEKQPEPEKPAGGVDPDLKAFLDSYEAFVDEYVAFMKKYTNDPTNAISMLGEYAEIMERYEDFAQKIDQYDSNEMSVEDAKYYLEVTNRCTQKMLDIL